eukprot:TRINITY_DN29342_c0_g1_i1.p1 TRINITY_DN29342_c0_g1~~TRINITY_DN29342_c0_g1_i1.p1  ORF type:complete len:215 (-),score=36.63 TRINITY_DN29342_c0_g1_i1:393-1037(-)
MPGPHGGPGGPFGGPGGPGPHGPPFGPLGHLIGGAVRVAGLAAAGAVGWVAGRNASGQGKTEAQGATAVETPAPAEGAGVELEVNVKMVSLAGSSAANASSDLFEDDDVTIVLQVGESTGQRVIHPSTDSKTDLTIDQTLYLPLRPAHSAELQVAVYGSTKKLGLLALGRVNLPQPQQPGKPLDVMITLSTPGGSPCGQISTSIGYNLPFPKPV